MLKQGAFIKNKYRKLMVCNLLNYGTYGINLMIDSLVGGNQLGETALTAVSIVAPLFSIITFIGALFVLGCCVKFGKHIGEFNNDDAEKSATLGVLAAIASSVLMAVVLIAIKSSFLSYFECTGELLKQTSTYYNWVVLYMLIYPFYLTLYNLVLMDGDGLYPMAGSISEIIINIVFSIVLCQRFGIAGLGIATCAGAVIGILFYCCHFFCKTNSIHFRLYWSWSEIKEDFILSMTDSMGFLFLAVVDIVMNKVILTTCGMEMVAAYSVINLIFNIFYVFCAPFSSCAGFCTTFLGEKNNYGIRNTLRMGSKSIVHIGIVMMLMCFFGAPLIPQVYGMTTPAVVSASIQASRIMAFTAIPYGFAMFWEYVYPLMEKPMIGLFVSFLNNLLCPLVISIPFVYIWGFTGVSIGMSLSSFLVIAFFVIIMTKKYGKKDFPLYLEDYGEEVIGYDLYVTKETIPEIRDAVKLEFDRRGYEVKQLEILVEELYTRIMEKNPSKTVMSECALLFGENHVRIIVRDNGVVFNFVDENNVVESLNAHVLNSLLEQTKEKNYILTTSFNRNGFIFEK